MYNRYIGNTGKFYRVEDMDDIRSEPPPPPPVSPEPEPTEDRRQNEAPPPEAEAEKPKFDLNALFHLPGNLRRGIRDKLPGGIDLGDILLILVLIYLFLEGDDDDMLIILGVLIFIWVRPLLKKEEEEA
ncbi:MAG: hypothetical protein FWD99_08425 [Oscillospiraceae bacterium]|nr:hypothetical protein [Oscillospiraceae bacterium]